MKDLYDNLQKLPKNQWTRNVRKNKTWMHWLKGQFTVADSLNEQIHMFMNGLTERPKCLVSTCNNKVNWIYNHYGTTCGYSCAQAMRKESGTIDEINQKIKQTTREKYGVDHVARSASVQEKRKQTLQEKYGAIVSPKARESTRMRASALKQKGRISLRQRYNVNNPGQIPGHAEKVKQRLEEHFGVQHASQIPHVKLKRQHMRESKFVEMVKNVAHIVSFHQPETALTERFVNPNTRIEFQCIACQKIDTLPSETFKFRFFEFGSPCGNCTNVSRTSSNQEKQVRDFVSNLGLDVIANDRKQIFPYELDIWVPAEHIAIEYCGLYFHQEKSVEDRKRHLKKMLMCHEKNIQLITIFEDEWVHNPEIVKNRLRNLFKKNATRIPARKLVCKQITNHEANEFCKNYHIQGTGRTKTAFGLFAHGTLCSVMTFSALNIAKGSTPKNGSWELNRFCTLPDYTVQGGASKLFSNFVRTCNPVEVISYSDRRWNTGQVYQTLGFSLVSQTPPNYWYIDFGRVRRIHRYALKKNSADNPLLTEWENRQLAGWSRIWDCGNSKWIWTNEKPEQ